MSDELILTNARIVTPDAVIEGTLRVEGGMILEVDDRPSRAGGALDLDDEPPSQPIVTSPVVASSSVPAIVSSVLLPDPLGPMMATNSPGSTMRSTSIRASTRVGPSPYDLDTLATISIELTAAPSSHVGCRASTRFGGHQ